MLDFEKINQKNWTISKNGDEILKLKLVASSVTNKFHIVADFIQRISESIGPEFDDWFIEFYPNCSSDVGVEYIKTNIQKMKDFVDRYIDTLEIDFSKFVDTSKAKKGTILFLPDEIEKISRASGYLKLYSLIFNSDLKLSRNLHRASYNLIIDSIVNSEVVFKIFNIVKTKTYRYNLTDRYMWEYIKMIQCKTIDVHTVEIFNFIMNSILVLCEEDKNPITYFVGVVEESVKWFLRSVYKRNVIYDDSISTEDIHGLNIDNLKTYSYNDTLGRLKGIAYEQIYKELDKNSSMLITCNDEEADKEITEFQRRVLEIEFISPLSECLVFPILSTITEIPYTHFRTLSAEHSAVLSVYIHRLLKKVFKNEYSDLFSLLLYYPTTQPAIATTYRIKRINNSGGFISIQNNVKDFFGSTTKILPYEIMSYFVGRTSRVNWCNIFDGSKMGGIPLSKIENDVVQFYTLLFSGKLEPKIVEMKEILSSDF